MNDNKKLVTPKIEAKIIPFPKNKIVRLFPQDSDEIIAQKRKLRIADKLLSELIVDFMEEIKEGYELDISSTESRKDFSYLMEVLRSSVYRVFGIDHPLQQYVDMNVQIADDTAEENTPEETSNNMATIETTE